MVCLAVSGKFKLNLIQCNIYENKFILDKMNTFQRLKASFHFTTGKICEERAKELHLEVDKKVIACISNLGLQQLKIFSSDLESFAR